MKAETEITKECSGECPKCGSEGICYGDSALHDEQMCYEFTCGECGCAGKEWYRLTYIETVGVMNN